MKFIDFLPYIISVIIPIVTGLWAFIASTNKSKKDLLQIQEQNKLEIERLVNQHKLDLESLEIKHKMDIEKLGIEHTHKLELMQKELENSMGSGLMNTLIGQMMNMPEVQSQFRASIRDSKIKKHK